jgi:hypothetical protein
MDECPSGQIAGQGKEESLSSWPAGGCHHWIGPSGIASLGLWSQNRQGKLNIKIKVITWREQELE